MNKKEIEIITDAYVQHLENGYHSDIAGAFNDIIDFFNKIKKK